MATPTIETIVIGDLHTDFGPLNILINNKKPKIILSCGDFGYWNMDTWDRRAPKNRNEIDRIIPKDTKIYWCDGNHEDHFLLEKLRQGKDISSPIEIARNIFYCPRGSTLTLEDGRTVLFMGGADSHDKHKRTLGIDWFPEEVISDSDMENLPNPDETNIDIVISHTCPKFVCSCLEFPKYYYGVEKLKDPSCEKLTKVFDKYNPKLWYFGHWHMAQNLYVNRTFFQCLTHPRTGYLWWVPIKKK